MKYFLTESERKRKHSTLYFEFQKGKYRGICWREDSLCLHADIFDRLNLFDLFAKAIPGFDYYYSKNYVTQEAWAHIKNLAVESGGEVEKLITELCTWVEECFQEEKVFTICGI